MNYEATVWTSHTVYIDTDTGKQLTKFEATGKNSKYIIYATTKETYYNHNKTKGFIKYTRKCRRNPQTELEL